MIGKLRPAMRDDYSSGTSYKFGDTCIIEIDWDSKYGVVEPAYAEITYSYTRKSDGRRIYNIKRMRNNDRLFKEIAEAIDIARRGEKS